MKYKVGDKVKLRSKEGLDELKRQVGDLYIHPDVYKNAGSEQTILECNEGFYRYDASSKFWHESIFEGLVEEETLIERVDDSGLPFNEWLSHKGAFYIPDGYELKDENGNVINATKIVLEKKKSEYPKTYEECCKILNLPVRDLDILDNMLDTTEIIYSKNLDRLLNSFRKLLICRDAYWKIAGEEMELGKPWEPDLLDNNQPKFALANWKNTIENSDYSINKNYILIFPTEEMRDAFKENFKKEIEICKELL